jgi:hypothetical protein
MRLSQNFIFPAELDCLSEDILPVIILTDNEHLEMVERLCSISSRIKVFILFLNSLMKHSNLVD